MHTTERRFSSLQQRHTARPGRALKNRSPPLLIQLADPDKSLLSVIQHAYSADLFFDSSIGSSMLNPRDAATADRLSSHFRLWRRFARWNEQSIRSCFPAKEPTYCVGDGRESELSECCRE